MTASGTAKDGDYRICKECYNATYDLAKLLGYKVPDEPEGRR